VLTPLTVWLEKYQETGLWSQLLFSLSFTLACCIHAFRPNVPAYDSVAIGSIVTINVTSMFLTLAAFHQQIKWYLVFFPVLLVILVCALLAACAPLIRGRSADPILRACANAAQSWGSHMVTGVVLPFKFSQDLREYIAYPVFMFIFGGLWLFLWYHRNQWTDIRKVCSLYKSVKQ